MFKRKLKALNHFDPEIVDPSDDKKFKDLIVWLEDQKICHYKIEERGPLKDVDSNIWTAAYHKYLADLKCPLNSEDRSSISDWLLGLAIRLEYGDNVSKYKEASAANILVTRCSGLIVSNSNPLDSLDFSSPEFKNGITKLAQMLNVTPHPDHLVTLKAVSTLIQTRLSPEALQNPGDVVHTGVPYPIFETDLGFDTGDAALNQAGQVLRMLYIQDQRDLQTRINECLVAVQKITAHPKTDSNLGKVGNKS